MGKEVDTDKSLIRRLMRGKKTIWIVMNELKANKAALCGHRSLVLKKHVAVLILFSDSATTPDFARGFTSFVI